MNYGFFEEITEKFRKYFKNSPKLLQKWKNLSVSESGSAPEI